MLKKLILLAIFGIVACGGVLAGGLWRMSQPTEGEPIKEYIAPRQALLVVDIQEDFSMATGEGTYPQEEMAEVIAVVNRSAAAAQELGMLVVTIRQEFEGLAGTAISKLFLDGAGLKGNPGIRLDPRLVLPQHTDFTKPVGDAFSNAELDAFLRKNRVDTLYVTGLDGVACVNSTVWGALNRRYNVVVIQDGIMTVDKDKWQVLLEEQRQAGVQTMASAQLVITAQGR